MNDSDITPPDFERHEAQCRRCGRCCVEKIAVNDEVFTTARACAHFDPATKLCAIYERRFEINPRCLTVPRGIQHRVFPADCPYVDGVEGYRPPHDERTSEGVIEMIEAGEIRDAQELSDALRRCAAEPEKDDGR